MDRFRVSSEEGLMMGGRYLSKEVLCRILGRLPARSFLRLRCVCKRWYAIMEDCDFRAICASIEFQDANVSDSVPFLVWQSANDSAKPLLVFDLKSRTWRFFDLLEGPCSKLTVLSSAGGLVLASVENNDEKLDYITFNPLTKLRRMIPPTVEHNGMKFNLGHIVMDSSTSGRYSLIAEEVQAKKRSRGDGGEALAPLLQIFDSDTNGWHLVAGLRPGLNIKQAAWWRGSLFCLAASGDEGSGEKSVQLFKFDGAGSWATMQTPLPVYVGPSHRRWTPRLFESRQRLMLVGESASAAVAKCVYVWQLEEEKSEWVVMQSMPVRMYEDSVGSYEFMVSEDFLCMYPSRQERNRVITCDLAAGSWQILPYISPRLMHNLRTASIRDNFFLYEPNVGATA